MKKSQNRKSFKKIPKSKFQLFLPSGEIFVVKIPMLNYFDHSLIYNMMFLFLPQSIIQACMHNKIIFIEIP